MPRRRRVDDAGCSLTSEHITIDHDALMPTLNRFADDTSMLGFRYLHTRYKTWFRILWAFILIFFLGLTVYQVTERITYYFIRNPLKTLRTYDTPTEMLFPAVVLCNKLQLRASKIAAQSPDLLRIMSVLHEDDGSVTLNRTLRSSLNNFNDINVLEVFSKAAQSSEDFVISCEYGKGGSCVEDVRPILTPKGVCFEVAPNITIWKSINICLGPETTLSLLLNLEQYEIIPGTVIEAGVILSLYDSQEAPSSVYAEGIHLEPGKVVTIPINDVRKLYRYGSACGRREVGRFSEREYSRAGCQWSKQYEEIQKTCRCTPFNSPTNRRKLLNLVEEKNAVPSKKTSSPKKSERKGLPPCTLSQEYECVANMTAHLALPDPSICPEDCEDIAFSSVVFGGRLNPPDIERHLPTDWDDIKEKRIEQFQPALSLIENKRIPVVRSVQLLAYEAQSFLNKIIDVFQVNSENSQILPCISHNGTRLMDRLSVQFFNNHRIWRNMKTYLDLVFPYHLDEVLDVLGLKWIDNQTMIMSGRDSEVNTETLDRAIYNLNRIETSLREPQNVFGIKSMELEEQQRVVLFVSEMISEAASCIGRARSSHSSGNRQAVEKTLAHCSERFSSHFEILSLARKVISGFDSPIFADFESLSYKMISHLQRVKYHSQPKIFTWKMFNMSLRDVEYLYKEGGKEHTELIEFLKLRKMINSDMGEVITAVIAKIGDILSHRRRFLERLSIGQSGDGESVDQMRRVQQCLTHLLPQLHALRRFPFMRAEWMARLERQVELAQSYSPGHQYDRVNLLHIKLYYAHFKQEIIRQEKSYNLFLLLAEIGGTIGLYVGATLLTAAETFVFFIEKRTRKLFVKPQYC